MLILSTTILNYISLGSGFILELIVANKFGFGSLADNYRIACMFVVIGNILFYSYLLPRAIVLTFSRGRKFATQIILLGIVIIFLPSVLFALTCFLDVNEVISVVAPGVEHSINELAYFIKCYSLVPILMTAGGILSAFFLISGHIWVGATNQIIPNIIAMAIFIMIDTNNVGMIGAALPISYLVSFIFLLCLLPYAHIRKKIICTENCKIKLSDLLRPILPLLIITSIAQINMLVINNRISFLEAGSYSTFWICWKLLAIISSISYAVETYTFVKFNSADADEVSLSLVIRYGAAIFYITMLAALIAYYCTDVIVETLYGFGKSIKQVNELSTVLACLIFVVPANSALSIFLNHYSSRVRYNTPLLLYGIANISLNFALVYFFGNTVKNVAIAITINSWVFLSILLFIERKHILSMVYLAKNIFGYILGLALLCLMNMFSVHFLPVGDLSLLILNLFYGLLLLTVMKYLRKENLDNYRI